MVELNSFYVANSVEFMQQNMEDNFVDLTITSPPYDDLRKYHGFTFDYQSMFNELLRVTKDGGVVVWIVGDKTENGCETLTSFKQILYAKDIGFNVGDTMIWQKQNPFNFGSNYFYPQSFEYMFILTKGKIKTSNLIRDRVIKNAGMQFKQTRRSDNDYMEYDDKVVTLGEMGKRYNVWTMPVESVKGHPAPFPEQLALDHILSWSNEGDIVFDPMCGSGTTCKMAYLNDRNFIGVDMSEEYISKICIPRLQQYGY